MARAATSGRWKRWAPVGLYAAFIFWLSSQTMPPVLGPLAVNDKVKHFALYAVFAGLVWRAMAGNGRHPLRAAAGTGVLVALYGASDELHQHFVPGRSADVMDGVVDAVAGFLVAALLCAVAMARKKPGEGGS